METAKIYISLPFRVDGPEEDYPGCLKSFDARHMDRFFSALYQEIRLVSEESDDLLVQEIEIGNGSAAHLTADDLTGIIRTIQQQFHVSPKRKIRLTMTPSGFDFYKLSAVRQLGSASIRFEFPSLADENLQTHGYHCSGKQVAAALDTCFQNAFRSFSVFLTAKDLEPEKAEITLRKLLSVHPEEILLRTDAAQPFVRTAENMLSKAGWTQEENHWYRDKVPSLPHCTVQIGCGPGAISIFDGIPVKTTADFDFYCNHAGDFEALVAHAQKR